MSVNEMNVCRGGGLTAAQQRLVVLGEHAGLLSPGARELDTGDRQDDARWAITGVLLLAISTLIDVVDSIADA